MGEGKKRNMDLSSTRPARRLWAMRISILVALTHAIGPGFRVAAMSTGGGPGPFDVLETDHPAGSVRGWYHPRGGPRVRRQRIGSGPTGYPTMSGPTTASPTASPTVTPPPEPEGELVCGGTVNGSTAGADHAVGNDAGEHLYTLTITETRPVVIDACESQYDTYLRVYDSADVLTSNQIAENDDNPRACAGVSDNDNEYSGNDNEYAGNDNAYASHLTRTLEPGVYTVVIEGYHQEGYNLNEGFYSITLGCPTMNPTPIPPPSPPGFVSDFPAPGARWNGGIIDVYNTSDCSGEPVYPHTYVDGCEDAVPVPWFPGGASRDVEAHLTMHCDATSGYARACGVQVPEGKALKPTTDVRYH